METEPDKTQAGFFFDDPRLRMSVAGRLLVRVAGWVMYLVLIGATIALLVSGIGALRAAGVLLALIVIDFIEHRGEGDVPISELRPLLETPGRKINLADVMRPATFTALERGFDAALIAGRPFYLEVAERLIDLPEVEQGLVRLDVPLKDFKQKLDELASNTPTQAAPARLAPGQAAPVAPGQLPAVASPAQTGSAFPSGKSAHLAAAERLVLASFAQALAAGHNFIEPADLFSGLPGVHDDAIDRLFNLYSVDAGDIERALILSAESRRLRRPKLLGGFVFEAHRRIPHRVMNRAWTSRPTPILDRYGEDFTDLAREGQIGFLVGHGEEYNLLVETLARPTNPNALLIGEGGIGRESIVKHLAFRLLKDDVPRALFDKRIVSLELQNVVAGATPDIVNDRLKAIVGEIEIAGNVILYIPDIHNLVKTAGTAYLSAADALMPVIMNSEFPIVGTTYPKEFKQIIEPRSDFTAAFEMIPVGEISEEDAERVLTYDALILEQSSDITVSFGAVKRAVLLAKKYLHDKFLPMSAEELLKSAIIEAERRGDKTLGPDLVIKAAEARTKIPIHEAADDEAGRLLKMEETIHERLIGQDEAVRAIATALREYRSGLARKGGPIASFLFVGPTGVGKTELAKILADVQFGSEKMMSRFDMTEYQDKASYVRFIGSPDGSVRGALTDAVLGKPYSLVLLDEFEKAYPDILNLFLQVLDDGRLTDSLGRVVDFTNTIIIATSNAHSDIINEALAKGESMADIAEYLKSRLVDVFKPELINRFSKIIIFKNLVPSELAQIVTLNMAELGETLKGRGIHLEVDPAAAAQIAKLGYDPAFGARPLRRVIEEKIRAPLAEAILSGTVIKGGRIRLVFENNEFGFRNDSAAGA